MSVEKYSTLKNIRVLKYASKLVAFSLEGLNFKNYKNNILSWSKINKSISVKTSIINLT